MSKQNPDQFMRPVLDQVRHNPGVEIIRYGRRKPDILSLGVGEGDQTTPSFINEAMEKALMEGKTFYGPVLGRDELRQAISEYYKNIYNLDIAANRAVVTASGSSAVHIALTSIIEKEDEVVAVTPLWKNLLGAVKLQQAVIREVPLDHKEQDDNERQWQLDLNKLFSNVTDKTRAIMINSPNNPSGWVIGHDQIEQIMDFARQRNIWVISDEVYSRLTYQDDIYEGQRAPSFLDIARPDDRLYVINSFSKNWAMTGWRLGWLVAPEQAIERLYDLVIYDNMGPSNFLQFGGIAALTQGEQWLSRFKSHCRENRDFLMQRFSEISRIKADIPQSTFYSFFQIEGEPDCMALARRLIDDKSLSLGPGCSFGSQTAGYLRLCFAVGRPKLEEALNRLEEAVGS